MQTADDVQLGDPDGEGLLRLLHHVRHGQFEAVGVPFFSRERAELAAQDAVVGVVEISIENVARAVVVFAAVDLIGQLAKRVEVVALKQP